MENTRARLKPQDAYAIVREAMLSEFQGKLPTKRELLSWFKQSSWSDLYRPLKFSRAVDRLIRDDHLAKVGSKLRWAEASVGSFDYESDVAAVKISDKGVKVKVAVYSPIENIGKRGAKVEVQEYRLYLPGKRARSWAAKIKSRFKPNMSLQQILTTIRSTLQEAEKQSIMNGDDYPAKMYEPVQYNLKGVSPMIPDRSTDERFEGQDGRDIGIRYRKPNIVIFSKRDAKLAFKTFEQHYLVLQWTWAKKIAQLADQLIKLRGLEAVEEMLKANRIPYKTTRQPDEVYASGFFPPDVMEEIVKMAKKLGGKLQKAKPHVLMFTMVRRGAKEFAGKLRDLDLGNVRLINVPGTQTTDVYVSAGLEADAEAKRAQIKALLDEGKIDEANALAYGKQDVSSEYWVAVQLREAGHEALAEELLRR